MNLRYDYYVKSVVRRHLVAPSPLSPPFILRQTTNKTVCVWNSLYVHVILLGCQTVRFAQKVLNFRHFFHQYFRCDLSTLLSRTKTELLSVIRKARPFFWTTSGLALIYTFSFLGTFTFKYQNWHLERISWKYHFRQSSRHGGVASDPAFCISFTPNTQLRFAHQT